MINLFGQNPVFAMMQAMQQGQSPVQFLQGMASQDPRAQQAMQIIRGKDSRQLETIARNMARENGIDIDTALRQVTGR